MPTIGAKQKRKKNMLPLNWPMCQSYANQADRPQSGGCDRSVP